jgi:hypothetical protein
VYGNGSGAFNFTRGGSDYSYTESSTITSAPQFVNSSSSGFDPHLSSSSPAIGSGLNLSSTFTTDKDGSAWPSSGAWDQGAYRYGSSSDTTPPSVSLSAPANNATVSGTFVTVSASASDNVGVVGVQFKLDGSNLGAEHTSAPYNVTWNTTAIANGSHTLSASARDAAGNESTATEVTIEVSNVATALPTVTVTATDAQAAEAGLDPGMFTFARTGGTTSALTVNYDLSGSATRGNDYRTLEGDMPDSITIAAGASSATLIFYPVSDTEVEGKESVILTLAPDVAYAIGSAKSATVNIADARRVRRQASTGSDTDGDGIADGDELISGTDPNNSRSVLKISSVAQAAGGGIELTWPSVAGKSYRVSFAESLEDGYWTDVSQDIVADDVTTRWTDTGNGFSPMRFYSVTVVTP